MTVNLTTGVVYGGVGVGTDTFSGVNRVEGSSSSDLLIGGQVAYSAGGTAEYFEGLSGDDTSRSYAELGVELNLSEGAARVAAHRMRVRYTELLRVEISKTLASPAEIDAELNALRAALTS